MRRRRTARRFVLASVVAMVGGACSPIVRYTGELVDEQHGRTWFTRLPATIGGTTGFIVGIPVDIVAAPVSWLFYRTQPHATRDPTSVFLFPSFALWRLGMLLGGPFDLVELALWRAWGSPPVITKDERDLIEREWDRQQYYDVYPVTPVYPPPEK